MPVRASVRAVHLIHILLFGVVGPLLHLLLHGRELLDDQRREFLGLDVVPRHVDAARIHHHPKDQPVDLLADNRGVRHMLHLMHAPIDCVRALAEAA